MKQLLQDISTGSMVICDAPSLRASGESLVIDTTQSLISIGTERMLVDFGRASLIGKARQQPEKLKMVLDKIKTDGVLSTIDAVRTKLAEPMRLGYCNVGVVRQVGSYVETFQVGDRVVSNGPHADVVRVSKNLCAKIPDNVSDESAVFTVLASIGLQGIRLAAPTLGEAFVVTGVGLIGLLTVQLLRANGCRVLAIDYDPAKLELAKKYGAEICDLSKGDDPISISSKFSRGKGIDGVVITASTKSNDPVSQAAHMCRKRGRIVLVGVTGLELNRADFYEKELTFQVSCSYGPGRYDPVYEEKGQDYPLGFVRWTEQRNFEAVLDMMASGSLDVSELITHRYAFEDAPQAYQVLAENNSALGILLQYTSDISKRSVSKVELQPSASFDANKPVVGFIGAGNYSSRVLIPAFKAAGAQLHTIVTTGGLSGVIHGRKGGFSEASADVEAMLVCKEINTVSIVTRHDSHAHFVVQALKAGKHVFVEKPLALRVEEISMVESAYYEAQTIGKRLHLMLGFNRRFSPQVQRIKELLRTVNEPKAFIMTVNAGFVPSDNWVQDYNIGGGRIIGEACHFIDLMRFLAESEIVSVSARRMGGAPGVEVADDKAMITLGFSDGSVGTIHYLSNGSSSFPKERIEVFAAGRILQLDNFRKLRAYGWPGFNKMNLWKQDKGQRECVRRFLHAIESGDESPIPIAEVLEVARVSIEVATQLRLQST